MWATKRWRARNIRRFGICCLLARSTFILYGKCNFHSALKLLTYSAGINNGIKNNTDTGNSKKRYHNQMKTNVFRLAAEKWEPNVGLLSLQFCYVFSFGVLNLFACFLVCAACFSPFNCLIIKCLNYPDPIRIICVQFSAFLNCNRIKI